MVNICVGMCLRLIIHVYMCRNTWAREHVHTRILYKCLFVFCRSFYMLVCGMSTCVYLQVCMHACMHVCMYVCMYVCMHVKMHV